MADVLSYIDGEMANRSSISLEEIESKFCPHVYANLHELMANGLNDKINTKYTFVYDVYESNRYFLSLTNTCNTCPSFIIHANSSIESVKSDWSILVSGPALQSTHRQGIKREKTEDNIKSESKENIKVESSNVISGVTKKPKQMNMTSFFSVKK